MPDTTVNNWFGNITSHPQVIVDANSVDDIAAILRDPAKFLHRCAPLVPITPLQSAGWQTAVL